MSFFWGGEGGGNTFTCVTPRAASAGRISGVSRSESRSSRHSPSPSPPACPARVSPSWPPATGQPLVAASDLLRCSRQ